MGDELQETVAPVVEALGLELVDLNFNRGLLRVTVDRDGGVDLDSIADVTREVSSALDRNDIVPGGRYTLEVSSPGLERPLKTPAQFARAVGEEVVVRTLATSALERRIKGALVSADADGIVIAATETSDERVHIAYSDIERARTVFEWGAAPKPAAQPGSRSTKQGRKADPTTKRAVAS
ncbi:MAG: ribosome maturation factor RimP [Acidimicrobiales bacterium]